MKIIILGIVLIALVATMVIKADKKNPRLAGNRLMSKGILVFLIGWLMFVLGAELDINFISNALRIVGSVVLVIGFIIAIVGWIMSVKLGFKRLDSDDIKRMVDPGYDIPYTQCPHCHEVEVRVFSHKAKCPRCGGIIKA